MTTDKKLDIILSRLEKLEKNVSKINNSMATKSDLKNIQDSMATKSDLKSVENSMATKSELKNVGDIMATKDSVKNIQDSMATRDDLKNTERNLKDEIIKNRQETIHSRDLLLEDVYKRLDKLEDVVFHTN